MSLFAGRDAFVFDLDNTLYDAETTLFPQIDARMTAYIARLVGVAPAEARILQKRYLEEHGATIAGLVARHGCDPHDFLHDVHSVTLDALLPDPALAALIARAPGRRIVFTNGSRSHAERVIDRLGLAGVIDAHFALEDAGFAPKPQPEAFARLIEAHAIEPARAVMFEDAARNLAPAHALGFATVWVRRGADADAPPPAHVARVTDCLKTFLAAELASAAA